MLKQVEGSAAVAEAIALCRPQVICAYPISPQTHIVEALGRRVDAGELAPCEFTQTLRLDTESKNLLSMFREGRGEMATFKIFGNQRVVRGF